MKMVKNIAVLACAASFMFASVSFHMSNVYTNMDDATGVGSGFGASWALNENTSLGFDSQLGMIFSFDVPAGISLRFGTDDDGLGDGATTSVGLGYTWWTGGTGLQTSISTAYDMVTDSNDSVEAEGKLSVTVGFGF